MKWFGLKSAKPPKGNLYEMAHLLHLERRLHPRVRLPDLNEKFNGPKALIEGAQFPIWDLSESGVCLTDDADLLRSKVGQKFSMSFYDSQIKTPFEVQAKLVATNLNKKHIQFEGTSAAFVEFLRPWINMGLRGTWMKNMASDNTDPGKTGTPARYKLFWGSILDDSLLSSTDVRWEFELFLKGVRYCLPLSSWPSDFKSKHRISEFEFDMILTFLANINARLFDGQEELIKKLGDVRHNEQT